MSPAIAARLAMSRRAAARLVYALLGLWVLLAGLAAFFAASQDLIGALIVPLHLAPMAIVGTMVSARRPGNPIGWILLAVALLVALDGALAAYVRSSSDLGSLAAGEIAAWLDSWLWLIWMGLAGVFLPLLFPDGRLPGRHWRALPWLGAATIAVAAAGWAFGNREIELADGQTVGNPLAIPGAVGRVLEQAAHLEYLVVVMILGAVCGLAVRLRRSRGAERQQLKWVAYATALSFAAAAITAAGEQVGSNLVAGIGWLTLVLSLILALPAAIGVAILRYRLYDIDVVINRTLVYGALTATLAACYLASVLLLQLALSPGSDLAVAGSTLVVAALFRPARRRIQTAVDRRFYRRRYDAARTLEAFSARLRAEIDLDSLSAELRAAVRETVQPAHVSVWLRTPEARR